MATLDSDLDEIEAPTGDARLGCQEFEHLSQLRVPDPKREP
jgi:hypothetical protein